MKKGYSVTEVLITVAIIGIIVSVVLAGINHVQSKNKDTSMPDDVYCKKYYSDVTKDELPARCINYFTSSKTINDLQDKINTLESKTNSGSTGSREDCYQITIPEARSQCLSNY